MSICRRDCTRTECQDTENEVSAVLDRTTGNFRLRQNYDCSNGTCTKFKSQIIQKLPGSGRSCTVVLQTKKIQDYLK